MMTDDLIAGAEKRGYSKGYTAGRRRLDRENRQAEIVRQSEAFRRDVFCAALQGTLMNGTWRNGDEPWRSIDDYVRGAWKFADAAAKGTWFS